MAVTIRLRQQGRKNNPFYRLVLTETRARRDGGYKEALGWYNPAEKEDEKNVSVKADRIAYWLDQGAELSDKAKSLVARAAPEVIRQYTEKRQAQRVKAAAKKRELRKKQAA